MDPCMQKKAHGGCSTSEYDSSWQRGGQWGGTIPACSFVPLAGRRASLRECVVADAPRGLGCGGNFKGVF